MSPVLAGGLRGLLAVAAGAIAALGQPPQFHWYLTLLALAALFGLFAKVQTSRQGAGLLWLFATAYFGVALRWIVEPFQVEAEVFGWMAPFALVFMAGGLALFWAVAGAIAARAGPLKVQALVLCLAIAELARAYVLTGFPWAGLAQIWVDHGMAQLLAWIGPHGLGLMTLAMVAAPICLSRWTRWAALGLGGAILVSTSILQTRLPSSESAEHLVRIVQPNAPQHQKWDPDHAGRFFWRQIEATRDGHLPDLVVWPETAIPQLLNNADETLEVVKEAARGVPLVLGILRAESGQVRNSLIMLDAQGEISELYDKHHLVPFGEYMPFASLVGQLGIRGLAERAEGGMTPGPGPVSLPLGPVGRALPLICYEAVFPHHARARDVRPDFLVQITNDAWFGAYAGPQQHLAQARMRAIEQGLPMVRAANTGISAMIDPRGRITASLGLGIHGGVDAVLPQRLSVTLYSKTGDWPWVFVFLAASLLITRKARNQLTIDAGTRCD